MVRRWTRLSANQKMELARATGISPSCGGNPGNPRQYLTVLCQARLTVMRGEVMDYRHGEQHGGAADGDLSWTEQTEAGLHVPIGGKPLPDPSEYDG